MEESKSISSKIRTENQEQHQFPRPVRGEGTLIFILGDAGRRLVGGLVGG